jgi:hypothetical protein
LVLPPSKEKKFLPIPSGLAGLSLGICNYMLGYISELGIVGALLFCMGALVFTTGYRIHVALKMKKETGEYFPISKSNHFYLDSQGKRQVKWMNVLGLIIRPIVNVAF